MRTFASLDELAAAVGETIGPGDWQRIDQSRVDLFEEEFRTAEGFFAVLAALGGSHLLRTHEVAHVRAVLTSMAELSI